MGGGEYDLSYRVKKKRNLKCDGCPSYDEGERFHWLTSASTSSKESCEGKMENRYSFRIRKFRKKSNSGKVKSYSPAEKSDIFVKSTVLVIGRSG
ncbi:hypothetical protein CEXT_479261 [Caerostris extrusa]|uniref:Uncharacterized protein n=1 Tax=Caerostris extrusa TaxID=172846 RepID=A0AAV4U0M5_CAEEX|nr:hypothetical protein CEXT_479261 [Caerostris extrusa]